MLAGWTVHCPHTPHSAAGASRVAGGRSATQPHHKATAPVRGGDYLPVWRDTPRRGAPWRLAPHVSSGRRLPRVRRLSIASAARGAFLLTGLHRCTRRSPPRSTTASRFMISRSTNPTREYGQVPCTYHARTKEVPRKRPRSLTVDDRKRHSWRRRTIANTRTRAGDAGVEHSNLGSGTPCRLEAGRRRKPRS